LLYPDVKRPIKRQREPRRKLIQGSAASPLAASWFFVPFARASTYQICESAAEELKMTAFTPYLVHNRDWSMIAARCTVYTVQAMNFS
jgi:hypothetical protein